MRSTVLLSIVFLSAFFVASGFPETTSCRPCLSLIACILPKCKPNQIIKRESCKCCDYVCYTPLYEGDHCEPRNRTSGCVDGLVCRKWTCQPAYIILSTISP